MHAFVRNSQKKVLVDRVYIKKQTQHIMKIIKLEKWEVNVNLVGDRKIAKLNEYLLKKKGRTDIISVSAQVIFEFFFFLIIFNSKLWIEGIKAWSKD